MDENIKQPTRTRPWAFIVWKESAPKNWMQRLDDLHIPAACSPIHDRDRADDNTQDPVIGEDGLKYKKPHWHVLINFAGVKSYEQVKDISQYIAGTNPISINDVGGYARYLIHEDNPDKFHYYRQDVKTFAGFDYDAYFDMPKSKVFDILKEVSHFIIDKDIREFSDLADYCLIMKPEWFYVVMMCCTSSIKEVIKSRRHKLKMLEQLMIDQASGELVPDQDHDEE